MDDFLRYEEFFKDDEDSEDIDSNDNEYTDHSVGNVYHSKSRTDNRSSIIASKEEKGADAGCIIMVMFGVICILKLLFW